MTRDQDIRLGDFGLAKLLTSNDLASSVVGTPTYMCPELLADIPYGFKSDIWSLGCCMYEMSAHKPAFKAFDMQALINKINKSILAPLPTLYSGAFRGLVKSMLRKNPELRPSAAELLLHPHLKPYTLKIHLKSNSPRRSTFPIQYSDSYCLMKTRFMEAKSIPKLSEKTLNCHISVTEKGSLHTSGGLKFQSPLSNSSPDLSVGSITAGIGIDKQISTRKFPFDAKTPRLTPSKASATPRRTTPSKTPCVGLHRDSLTPPRSPLSESFGSIRRASLPFQAKAYSPSSPNVSVNAPRLDCIAAFPLASNKNLLSTIHKALPASPRCSSKGDCMIMKDKCMVQIVDKRFAAGDCSQHEPMTVVSSHSSNSRQHRFDTSSYQQRAEALEGLLEFSARLLQQQRLEELGVLLKPFGPEKVSPRETAIWLTKSIKESAA